MKFSFAIILALPLLASAKTLVSRHNGNAVACCESLHGHNSAAAKQLLKENNLENHPLANGGMVAEGCNTGLGVLDSPTCSSTPVICDAMPGSIIGIGCVPVML
ncbi:hypothetical protein BDY19DRAFT_666777 [Irpex rosettiformis]|uniref:Uncharacterized protein n=1 Tax=Irpex rosettiformis TaxID=378272 RepID=A0ACB8U9U2_9APHY|nr:hypothetical protein BDY19DRAFT_666777 [Irpex rosettiformis]